MTPVGMKEGLVLIKRGGYTECLHHCHAVAVDKNGGVIFQKGDENFFTCTRSAAKPLQAIPIVLSESDKHYNLSEKELASFNGSLNGEDFQVEVVRSILGKAGIDENCLKCGTQYPAHKKSAEKLKKDGIKPAAVYHNCAAKHAGMLITCKHKGYDLEDYLNIVHPLQQEILEIVADYAELKKEEIKVVVDGCGLPVFFMPLKNIAVAYKNLALKMDNKQSRVRRLLSAGLNNPEMVGGTDRLCTDVIRFTNGKVFAKVGAEGLYAAFNTERREALAVKVEDGASRALHPFFVRIMKRLGWLEKGEFSSLEKYWNVPVKNSRGDVVGEIVVEIN